jgi:hypothetical protein
MFHFSSPPTLSDQVRLAGHAVFPEKEYEEWRKIQQTPHLDEEERIKNTVDTFVILQYESWKRGVLLDFGFLFDQLNPRGEHQYANERGLIFLRVVGGRAWGDLNSHYDYKPQYQKIEIEGSKAIVEMEPSCYIVPTDVPDRLHYSSFGTYTILMQEVQGKWLIREIDSTDEAYMMFPRETDFHQRVQSMLRSIRTARDYGPTNEIIRKRRNEARILYSEIAGEYSFDRYKDKSLISFGVVGAEIAADIKENKQWIKLFPFKRNEIVFSAISPEGDIYEFQFFRDEDGKINKCVLRTLGNEYKGVKIKHGSDLKEATDIFPGIDRAYLAELKADMEKWEKDPELKEILEERKRSQQEYYAKQREEEKERVRIYHQISGNYIFESGQEIIVVSFFVKDRYLVGKLKGDGMEVILQRKEENPYEFEFRPRPGEVYKLKFMSDEAGGISQCQMTKNGREYLGEKMDKKNFSSVLKNI